MKRILALIISLTAAAMLFAGCGDSDVYDRPGTGTTIDNAVTEPPIGSDNGSYSADPDGDVSQTTDGILEDGIDGVEKGLDDIGDGIEEGADRLEDRLDGADDKDSEADGDGAADGDGEVSQGESAEDHRAEVNSQNNGNNNAGNTNGSTNGNSH